MTQIPKWLLQVHYENYTDLLSCRNNPSPIENELALEMYQKALPASGFADFQYILLNEWIVDKQRSHLGKGDIVLTNGKNILVVEIKRIKGYSKQVQLKNLLKVIRQSRYYALVIRRQRDQRKFSNPYFNDYFKKAKIHAAFYTNLDQGIILLKHPKRISQRSKQRMDDLEKDLTTQEIINTNQLDIQLIDDKTPVKRPCTSSQNVKQEASLSTPKQQKTPPIIIDLDKKCYSAPRTPKINTLEENITETANGVKIQTYTDSKNRKFLVDSVKWSQEDISFIALNSDDDEDTDDMIEIIDVENNKCKPIKSDDIIFLNEIKPIKTVSPDIILIENTISVPINSLQNSSHQNSPKIIPINLSLQLNQNFNIDCALSCLNNPNSSAPEQVINQNSNKYDEEFQSDISFQSFNELADQPTTETQSCNFISYYSTNLYKQSLKEIVQQKMKEYQIEIVTQKSLNKQDSQINNYSEVLPNQISQQLHSSPNKLQQQIMNIQEIETLTKQNSQTIQFKDNQCNMQSDVNEGKSTKSSSLSNHNLDDIFNNQDGLVPKCQQTLQQDQSQEINQRLNNDSFNELMFQQVLIQERIEEFYDNEEKADILSLIKQRVNEKRRTEAIYNYNKEYHLLQDLQLNDNEATQYNNDDKENKRILKLEKEQQTDFNLENKYSQQLNRKINLNKRKIIKIQEKSYQHNLLLLNKKFYEDQNQRQVTNSIYNISECKLSDYSDNNLQTSYAKQQQQQQQQQSIEYPTLNLQKSKIKIIRATEVLKGKKIEIVHKQPFRIRKDQFLVYQ